MIASPVNLAWAAGLFEGEGCFYFAPKSGSVGAALVSTDLDVLERFYRIVGVGRIYGPTQPPDGKTKPRKPRWQWSVQNFEEAQYIGCLFWHHLQSRRRAKLREILTRAANKKRIVNERRAAIAAAIGSGTQCSIALRFGVVPSYVTAIKKRMQHHGV